ncbi:MAG: C39 family peptidase [candidate division NC10 bacterium]|nr:C39 family peptidase [candidate division NC10 bacterium]
MLVIFSLVLSLLVGCAPADFKAVRAGIATGRDQGHYIPEVPFFNQQNLDYCGPASLAMVLNFWGTRVSQEEVAREVYHPSLKGALTFDLARYAERQGHPVRLLEGSLEAVKAEVMAHRPVLVLANLGYRVYPIYHYYVVVGFSEAEKTMIAHDSAKGENLLIPYRTFSRQWSLAGAWGMAVLPKPSPSPTHPHGWVPAPPIKGGETTLIPSPHPSVVASFMGPQGPTR